MVKGCFYTQEPLLQGTVSFPSDDILYNILLHGQMPTLFLDSGKAKFLLSGNPQPMSTLKFVKSTRTCNHGAHLSPVLTKV